MNENADQLRESIRTQEIQSESLRQELAWLERKCNHLWRTPIYTPIEIAEYTIPGDPVGTMGVDWRGPTHVPHSVKRRWTRICNSCGKKETTKTVKLVQETHDGCAVTREVPDFGD